jgi:hypothetical protein
MFNTAGVYGALASTAGDVFVLGRLVTGSVYGTSLVELTGAPDAPDT